VSKARDDYYRLKEEVDKYHEGFRGGIHEYVEELKSENEALKQSQSQKQKIKLYEKIEKLEAEKVELIKLLKKCHYFTEASCQGCNMSNKIAELLKKHGVTL